MKMTTAPVVLLLEGVPEGGRRSVGQLSELRVVFI
jgi:hypothetical protein